MLPFLFTICIMPEPKPKLAVSSCLMGNPVRYDGKDKSNQDVMLFLADAFEIFVICPEVAIGMSVPRLPVALFESESGVHATGIANRGYEITLPLIEYANSLHDQLLQASGYIFKARSPSCGVGSTPVFSPDEKQIRTGNGVFANAVRQMFPDMPVVEESDIEDEKRREDFREQVMRYHASRAVQRS